MDVDTFVARHAGDWRRLDELAGRRRLDGAEADELVSLYRQVATHLALIQTRAPEPELVARLSRLLARGRAAAVGTPRVRGWAALAHGVVVDFPVILATGLGLGYLRASSGSLYPCIALHALFNGFGLAAAAVVGGG